MKGKRVIPKPHKKYWEENIIGTIDFVEYDEGTEYYYIKWDKPVQGNDPEFFTQGVYLLEDLIILDRKKKLKTILQQ